MLFSLLFLWLLKQVGAISYPDFNFSTARRVFPLSFFFVGMVVTGLAALQYANLTSLCTVDGSS
jgi:hypothetical protein